MKIYIDKEYSNYINDLYRKAFEEINTDLNTKIQNFCGLIEWNTVITDFDLKDLNNKSRGVNSFDLMEELIRRKIRSSSNRYKITLDKINKNILFDNAYHFYSENKDVDEKKIGIAAKFRNIEKTRFYNDYNTRNDIKINNLRELASIMLPCNAMVIYDPYMLKPFKNRIEIFLNYIEVFTGKYKNDNKPFQLTFFIIKNDDPRYARISNNISETQINFTLRQLKNKNIETEIIVINYKVGDDRHILTNYSLIDIGHPDRDSVLNQSVIGLGNSKDDYLNKEKAYIEKLSKFKNLIEDVKSQKGNIKKYYTNTGSELNNRIFEHLKE